MTTSVSAMSRVLVPAVLAAATVSVGAAIGAGAAQASPNCAISTQLSTATATCNDADAPPGREYTVIVECVGVDLGLDPAPRFTVGPYTGGWGGWFTPTGTGSASCVGPLSAGIATGAHVAIYRE